VALVIVLSIAGLLSVINSDWFAKQLEGNSWELTETEQNRFNVDWTLHGAENDGLVVAWDYQKENGYNILLVEVDGSKWQEIGKEGQNDFAAPLERLLFDFDEHTALRIVDAETGEVYLKGLGPLRLQ